MESGAFILRKLIFVLWVSHCPLQLVSNPMKTRFLLVGLLSSYSAVSADTENMLSPIHSFKVNKGFTSPLCKST